MDNYKNSLLSLLLDVNNKKTVRLYLSNGNSITVKDFKAFSDFVLITEAISDNQVKQHYVNPSQIVDIVVE